MKWFDIQSAFKKLNWLNSHHAEIHKLENKK